MPLSTSSNFARPDDAFRAIVEAHRGLTDEQSADFEFNVIVVDNHSTDRTTEILRGISDPRVRHLVPRRQDLGIGGCWNEAIYSRDCGQYSVQLDSDDLYINDGVLRRIVAELNAGP
ncbi:DUF2783 domain-containing protein, partial [Lacticaseibacillus rhamnosus]